MIFLEQLIGNDRVKKHLKQVILNKAVGNSWLFSGPEGVGKGEFAYSFGAEFILAISKEKQCNKLQAKTHPDIHLYRPEGKTGMHSIDSMRQFCEEVYMHPHEAQSKVFILYDAERMLPSSANALLKTFEEPAKDSLIILISSSPQQLLPTITSRCRRVQFQALQPEEIANWLIHSYGITSTEAHHFASLAQGSLAQANKLYHQGKDPLLDLLYELLSVSEKQWSYQSIQDLVIEVEKKIDHEKKELEKNLHDTLIAPYKDLTALHKDSIEKEIAGTLSSRYLERIGQFLTLVLWWYRDLQLLSFGVQQSFVFHQLALDLLKKRIKQSRILSIESVQQQIEKALLGVERSMKVSTVLEAFFLNLTII
ncbi:MAG: holB [Chlamydiales bacterium]|jgi:DNA polymerase-3 subunit delta'|nr:holB [Chlamydiales bacterium]